MAQQQTEPMNSYQRRQVNEKAAQAEALAVMRAHFGEALQSDGESTYDMSLRGCKITLSAGYTRGSPSQLRIHVNIRYGGNARWCLHGSKGWQAKLVTAADEVVADAEYKRNAAAERDAQERAATKKVRGLLGDKKLKHMRDWRNDGTVDFVLDRLDADDLAKVLPLLIQVEAALAEGVDNG